MSYKKALNVLRALPDKRLIKGAYESYVGNTPCYCAVGALLKEDPQNDAVFELYNQASIGALYAVHREALTEATGLTLGEAVRLQEVNDENSHESMEVRYRRVLAWLQARVQEEGVCG